MKFLLLIIFTLIVTNVSAESGHAFILDVRNKKVKVISPDKWQKGLNLIVKNNTLSTVIGKIEIEGTDNIKFISVQSLKSGSIKLDSNKGQKTFFVPLSPPFQKIELKFGNKTYEIPPK